MKYTLNDGKVIVISDKEINKLMDGLNLSKSDAIDLWLSDNGYEINEEQEELNEKASKVHINKDVCVKTPTKERKKPEIKVSDEKKALFDAIFANLTEIYGKNAKILTKNKLIEVETNGIKLKIDVIQCRPPKQ